MSVFSFRAHMKLRAGELPAPNMRWPSPPKFGVMQPTIAIAQDVSCGRHDHSSGGYSEGHLTGEKLDTRSCLQNSCNATNSHFDNPEYQMSPPDSDDDSNFRWSGLICSGVFLSPPLGMRAAMQTLFATGGVSFTHASLF